MAFDEILMINLKCLFPPPPMEGCVDDPSSVPFPPFVFPRVNVTVTSENRNRTDGTARPPAPKEQRVTDTRLRQNDRGYTLRSPTDHPPRNAERTDGALVD